MTEPYRKLRPPHPRRRSLVLVLGAVVTVLVLGGLAWSFFMWPATCGTMLTTADAAER
ncbi:MAG: hypothetical protein JRG91_02645 [Deltaproteobacteria bacterium]|nr:hypothetical protein [Deltaproteobacteria bacterium]